MRTIALLAVLLIAGAAPAGARFAPLVPLTPHWETHRGGRPINGEWPLTSYKLALDTRRQVIHSVADWDFSTKMIYNLTAIGARTAQGGVAYGLSYYGGVSSIALLERQGGMLYAFGDIIVFKALPPAAPTPYGQEAVAGQFEVAGHRDGLGAHATFNFIGGMDVVRDAVFIADTNNNCYRRGDVVMTNGTMQLNVSTVAGVCGSKAGSANGNALDGTAKFHGPRLVAVTANLAVLFVAGADHLRKVTSMAPGGEASRVVAEIGLPQPPTPTMIALHPSPGSADTFILYGAGGRTKGPHNGNVWAIRGGLPVGAAAMTVLTSANNTALPDSLIEGGVAVLNDGRLLLAVNVNLVEKLLRFYTVSYPSLIPKY
jgi:hypothetical protein